IRTLSRPRRRTPPEKFTGDRQADGGDDRLKKDVRRNKWAESNGAARYEAGLRRAGRAPNGTPGGECKARSPSDAESSARRAGRPGNAGCFREENCIFHKVMGLSKSSRV